MELLEPLKLALRGEAKATIEAIQPYMDSEIPSYLTLEAHIIYAFILNRIGKFEEAQKSLKIFPKYFNHIAQSFHRGGDLSNRETELFCLFLLVKAFLNIKLGKLGDAEIQLEHASYQVPNIDNIWTKNVMKGVYYNEVGLLYWKMGKYDESIKSHEKAISIMSNSVNEVLGIAYNDLSISYFEMGKYKESLDSLEKAIPLLETNNSMQDYGYAIGNMGRVYRAMGELGKAKNYALKSLEIKQNVGNTLDIAVEYRNLGLLELYAGHFDESKTYFMKSLELRQQIENPIDLSESLYYLIILGLEHRNPKSLGIELKNYHEMLANLTKESDHSLIMDRYNLSTAILLTYSDNSDDISKSSSLLNSIISKKSVQDDIRLTAEIYNSQLLIDYLEKNNEPGKLKEFQRHIDNMKHHARKNHLYGLLIEVYILQSRFERLQNNEKGSKKALNAAMQICNQKSLDLLLRKVEVEYQELDTRSENESDEVEIGLNDLKSYLKSISSGLNIFG